MRHVTVSTLVALLLLPLTVQAKTLVLEGTLSSRIQLEQKMSFAVTAHLAQLSFTFALPSNFSNQGVRQTVSDLEISFNPEPAQVQDQSDGFGNHFKRVTWRELDSEAAVSVSFRPQLTSQLSAMQSSTAFPLGSLAEAERLYLQSTPLVQADDPKLAQTAHDLTIHTRTELEAVNAILNFVADRVKYSYNPKSYDARYTLDTGTGNCQNFAHIAMALLRAVGIPARIVGGVTLKEPWKVPVDKQTFLVQSMGQGGHAWMEIYFPDLGWLSYDPQQSRQFTSTRHIKQTHGLDSRDINDSWTATPYLPQYQESVEARFLDDKVALIPRGTLGMPRPYLISNEVKAAAPEKVQPPSGSKAPLPRPEPVPELEASSVAAGQTMEFGNTEFPNLVENFRVEGERGVKVLDKETSAYATSKNVYAQAFQVAQPMCLSKIALALHKFGGDGALYMDILSDSHGKPSLPGKGTGFRSRLVPLDGISRRPGYYWVDFPFVEKEAILDKGKYWIILRKSGDAIMNWFYLPGKPYSSGDDTRSTARGYQWEDILNWDFVFKVTGKALAPRKAGKGGEV